MAKKAYIGVDGIARKVKKIYLGADTEVPVYGEVLATVNITSSNIADMFTVTNGSYYFFGSGSIFTSNNYGDANTTATTTLTAKSNMTVSFDYSYSSEQNYDKFTLKVAGTTVENAVSGSTTNKSWSGSLVKGQKIEFTYTKDNSQDKNDDKCTFSNMVVTAMVNQIVGSETKPVARKVRRGYIGVGGVARPFWTGGELTYYGEVTPLASNRDSMTGASNDNYALFSGGYSDGSLCAYVATYDKNLTRGSATSLPNKVVTHGSVSFGEYALFAGGRNSNGSGSYNTVTAYDTNLTQTDAPTLDVRSARITGTRTSKYAIFAGGLLQTESISDPANDEVYAYDRELTRTLLPVLDVARCDIAATSIGELVVLAGGVTGGSSGGTNYADTVDCYDENFTKVSVDKMTTQYEDRHAANVGEYALIAGGYKYINGSNQYHNTVEIYDSDLTHTLGTPLSVGRCWAKDFSIGEYAAFAGGYNGSAFCTTVDAYDKNLTRTTPTGLNTADYMLASAVIGNFALLASGAEERKTVEAYTI